MNLCGKIYIMFWVMYSTLRQDETGESETKLEVITEIMKFFFFKFWDIWPYHVPFAPLSHGCFKQSFKILQCI